MNFNRLALVLMLTLASSLTFAAPGEVTGVVSLPKDLEKIVTPTGALFIIARKGEAAPAPGTPPIAVLKIVAPKFPQAFAIGAQNSMMGGKFEGPMTITARYSPTGDALDKSGPEGTDPKATSVDLGKTDLKIELKAKKK